MDIRRGLAALAPALALASFAFLLGCAEGMDELEPVTPASEAARQPSAAQCDAVQHYSGPLVANAQAYNVPQAPPRLSETRTIGTDGEAYTDPRERPASTEAAAAQPDSGYGYSGGFSNPGYGYYGGYGYGAYGYGGYGYGAYGYRAGYGFRAGYTHAGTPSAVYRATYGTPSAAAFVPSAARSYYVARPSFGGGGGRPAALGSAHR